MYYVYVYSDPRDDIPFYIGKGRGDRAYKHLRETKDNTENYLKYCKITSLLNGGVLPKIEIVFESDDEAACLQYEIELIQKYGRKIDGGCLTNMMIDHASYMSDMAKKPRDISYRKSMSEAKSGPNNPMWGVSPWNKGVPCSVETKEKISAANSGRVYTEEEHVKRQLTRGKTYVVIDPAGDHYTVKNLKSWAIERGLCPTNLREALVGYKGKLQYKGYTGYKVAG